MKNENFRILLATVIGAVLGIFCIIGQAQRGPANPLPNNTIYLIGAWYNRVIMGIMIGLAGNIIFYNKKPWINALIRGSLIGLVVSASFGLFQQSLEILYFFAGIFWGIINDIITTQITNKRIS